MRRGPTHSANPKPTRPRLRTPTNDFLSGDEADDEEDGGPRGEPRARPAAAGVHARSSGPFGPTIHAKHGSSHFYRAAAMFVSVPVVVVAVAYLIVGPINASS